MTSLPSLSCMVLYKNERPHLERLLPKLVEAFDDIVLVTNLEPSTDGSDELVAGHGLEPQRMEWKEDFAQARQFGLDRCRGDYAMWMDCDDDLITSRSNFSEAKLAAREFLAASAKSFYMHRIYHPDRQYYWVRENWFRKNSGVKVKYPTHEIYLCPGESEPFPEGLLDRMNAPLRADYSSKLWRYFDMLHRYLRDVDPGDPRCKFYLAREFRGPARAHAVLYCDFWDTALRTPGYFCFSDECWAVFNLFDLRAAVDREVMLKMTEDLLLRHPFEFLPQLMHCMARCELSPALEHGERFYRVLRERQRYATTQAPFSRGWYYDRALNCCGYYLFKLSVQTNSRQLAAWSVEMLEQADHSGCIEDVAPLARNNLKLARDWLAVMGGATG